jgi:hypothetical protein
MRTISNLLFLLVFVALFQSKDGLAQTAESRYLLVSVDRRSLPAPLLIPRDPDSPDSTQSVAISSGDLRLADGHLLYLNLAFQFSTCGAGAQCDTASSKTSDRFIFARKNGHLIVSMGSARSIDGREQMQAIGSETADTLSFVIPFKRVYVDTLRYDAISPHQFVFIRSRN